eukprot:2748914-Rhodomonas_salina.1
MLGQTVGSASWHRTCHTLAKFCPTMFQNARMAPQSLQSDPVDVGSSSITNDGTKPGPPSISFARPFASRVWTAPCEACGGAANPPLEPEGSPMSMTMSGGSAVVVVVLVCVLVALSFFFFFFPSLPFPARSSRFVIVPPGARKGSLPPACSCARYDANAGDDDVLSGGSGKGRVQSWCLYWSSDQSHQVWLTNTTSCAALVSCHFSVKTGWKPPERKCAKRRLRKSSELKSRPEKPFCAR